jgi:hypothetical protein
MNARDRQARWAGLLYVLMAVTSSVGLYILPSWSTGGGLLPAVARVVAHPFVYRLGILSDFVSQVFFVALVLVLHGLLREIGRRAAALMVALVLVQVPMAYANLLLAVAPVALLSGADHLAAFTREELVALAAAALQLRGYGIKLIMVLWGLWLLPFGWLTYHSRFIPRVLGLLLIAGGLAHVGVAMTSLLFPALERAVAPLTALAFGEIVIAFWLLLRGAPPAPAESGAAA